MHIQSFPTNEAKKVLLVLNDGRGFVSKSTALHMQAKIVYSLRDADNAITGKPARHGGGFRPDFIVSELEIKSIRNGSSVRNASSWLFRYALKHSLRVALIEIGNEKSEMHAISFSPADIWINLGNVGGKASIITSLKGGPEFSYEGRCILRGGRPSRLVQMAVDMLKTDYTEHRPEQIRQLNQRIAPVNIGFSFSMA